MKTQQMHAMTGCTEGRGGVGRRVLLASCGLMWALSCQSATKDEPKGDVAVSKEEAKQQPAAAAVPAAATQPAAQPSAAAEAPAVEASAPSAPTALNAPASATGTSLTPKPQIGSAPAAPSADAPSKAETKKGAVVSEEPFSVWLEGSSPLPVGAASNVDVVLVAKAPYHTNAEYPHKFKLGAAPAGLSYPEAVVKGMQVNPERSVLRVPVQAQQAGPATVSGTLSFSVCTEERCLVEKRDLSLALDAK